MGSQISANYENIEMVKSIDLWNIHTANHKVSKEKVALWVIDVPKLKERYKKKAQRMKYLDMILASLHEMRKYRHPRILKVLEIAEKKPEIGFASEPFNKCVASEVTNMHPMDVAYISFQVAEVMSFLSSEARIVHLGLNPTAILLDDQLSIKLTQFQWCSPINSQGDVNLSQIYEQLKEFSDNSIKPPEMLSIMKKSSNEEITSQADVFIFGLFLFETFTGRKFFDVGSNDPDQMLSSFDNKYSQLHAESKIPVDFLPLVRSCLNRDAGQRPTMTNVVQHAAFQSMQLKALRYIDIMLTKNPSDKFAFYKGLSKKIEDFSPSLQRIKFLPTLVNECIADVRFAPILLGAIFQISIKYSSDEFMELTWRRLSVLATVVNPPEVSIGLLRNLWVLMDKIDKRLHKDYVYPIIFSALNSKEPRIHNEVLKQIDRVIEEMSEDNLRSLILPRLFDLAQNSSTASVTAASLLCIAKSLKRIDNETFTSDFVPKLILVWRKFQTCEVGNPILEIFLNLKVSLDAIMVKILPTACEIAGSNNLEGDLRSRYCNYIIKSTQDFRDLGGHEKNFNDDESVAATKANDDNPFTSSAQVSSFETSSARTIRSLSVDNVPSNPPSNSSLFTAQKSMLPEPTNPFAASDNNDDIFSSNSSKKNDNNFTVENVFGAKDSTQGMRHTSSQEVLNTSSRDQSRPFTNDIFGKKDTADDIFGSANQPAKPPLDMSLSSSTNNPFASSAASSNQTTPSNNNNISTNNSSFSPFTTPSSSSTVGNPNSTMNSKFFPSSTNKPPLPPNTQPASSQQYQTSSQPRSAMDSIFGPPSSNEGSGFGVGSGNKPPSSSGFPTTTFGGPAPSAEDIFGPTTNSTDIFSSGNGGFGDFGSPQRGSTGGLASSKPLPIQQQQQGGFSDSSFGFNQPSPQQQSQPKPQFGAQSSGFNPFQSNSTPSQPQPQIQQQQQQQPKFNPFQSAAATGGIGAMSQPPGCQITNSGRVARTVDPGTKTLSFGQIRTPQAQQQRKPGNDLLDLF
ncbi:protein kinase [Tritrichomonas foetus]|uniref:Protein kinase n=1 Tax=Tritrichomonas foetus TaxID=1144522 RepID=A0A1J4KRI3_9EUKA|nr:protein kinase [Tritrichomonas foetus]|eukprot:OHT12077.1 protein kinase [Tritrichomonas foetus]